MSHMKTETGDSRRTQKTKYLRYQLFLPRIDVASLRVVRDFLSFGELHSLRLSFHLLLPRDRELSQVHEELHVVVPDLEGPWVRTREGHQGFGWMALQICDVTRKALKKEARREGYQGV